MMPLAKIDRSASSGAHGYLRWTTKVSGDGAEVDLMAVLMKPQPWLALVFWSMENLTSLDVIGWPLENFTPCRRVNV